MSVARIMSNPWLFWNGKLYVLFLNYDITRFKV